MKKLLRTMLFLVFVFAFAFSAYGQSCSCTEYYGVGMNYVAYSCAWVSDAAGAVTCSLGLTGIMEGVEFLCTATDEPTNLYDVTLEDGSGNDMFGGAGANIADHDTAADDNATWYRTPLNVDSEKFSFVNKAVTVTVANAGNAKAGTVVINMKVQ